MRTPDGARDHLIWIATVLAFTLAAATGALYRFAVAYGVTGGLNLVNVRHAHSHLMYFAWVTPALFLLISRRIKALTGVDPPALSRRSTIAALLLGLASYVPFIAFGYSTIAIGPATVPPAVIISGLNMLAWYGYVAGYYQQTRGSKRTLAFVFFDGALLFLVLGSLGAWSISLTIPLGIENPVAGAAFTHVFLGYFSEGWLLLAVLGLAISSFSGELLSRRGRMIATWTLGAGIAASFLLGMPRSMLSPTAWTIARVAVIFLAGGLSVFSVALLLRCDRIWRVPGLFLMIKTGGFLLVILTPSIWWADFVPERILYFHIHLLGFVTLGIFAAAGQMVATRSRFQILWMTVAVALVILSLLPMTQFWPPPMRGSWMFQAMAWAALLPVGVGLWMILFQQPEPLVLAEQVAEQVTEQVAE